MALVGAVDVNVIVWLQYGTNWSFLPDPSNENVPPAPIAGFDPLYV